MSGSGGSYPVIPTKECDCDKLIFPAIIQSPSSNTKLLSIGDELDVYRTEKNSAIFLRHEKLGVVGSITNRILQLHKCIDEGFHFVATVSKIDGIYVTVEVQSK